MLTVLIDHISREASQTGTLHSRVVPAGDILTVLLQEHVRNRVEADERLGRPGEDRGWSSLREGFICSQMHASLAGLLLAGRVLDELDRPSMLGVEADLITLALNKRVDGEEGVVSRARDGDRELVALVVVEIDERREGEWLAAREDRLHLELRLGHA